MGESQISFSVSRNSLKVRGPSRLGSSSPRANVSVQQELQSRRASHSSSSDAGEIMSPRISIRPFIEPIQAERSSTGEGGTTSATGFRGA